MKKILLAGGGSGGHIYPLVAIMEKIREIAEESDIEISYIGPKSSFDNLFLDRGVTIHRITSSKLRRYFDLRNFLDIPKFIYSIFEAWVKLFFIMPDIIFSKGGPGSLAVVIAAKFYFIPVVIHESDAVPSLTSRITGKLARKIGVAFKKTAEHFPESKVFISGNPIRKELTQNWIRQDSGKNYIGFNHKEPMVFILGGSQGSESINSFVLENIDDLLNEFQIYHQVGPSNINDVKNYTNFHFSKNPKNESRYKVVGNLNAKDIKIALNAADLIISRAGAGAVFEIAFFQKPSILIPLPKSANDHQKVNAYTYSKKGAAIVIEEQNLKGNILLNQIKNILNNQENIKKMTEAAKKFSTPDSLNIILREILNIIN